MGFLMGVLGWPPAVAWSATAREVRLALDGRMGRAGHATMDAALLAQMMAAWPDEDHPD